MEINGERSPVARYEEPILFNGHIGFTLYWGEPMCGIFKATALPKSHIETKDRSFYR